MNSPRTAATPRAERSLAGRQAVVTGSTSGIGRAIAERLAAAGAQVLVHGRANRAGAEATVAAIESRGGTAQYLLADLSQAEERAQFLAAAHHRLCSVDIWVNNAGADVLTGPASSWSFAEKLELLWRTDVLATLELGRAAGELMRVRGGVIVNIGWDQAETGMAGDSGEMFAAIKGAIMAFTKSLARSLAPHVRVHCVAPGWIRTQWGESASEYWQQRAAREALVGRWGTPDDVAHVVGFLVSDEASFLTGQVIPVNGGFRGTAES